MRTYRDFYDFQDGGKRLFMPQKSGFCGYFTPKMGNNINETPKWDIIARVRVVWTIKRENLSTGLTCEFPKNGIMV